MKTYRVFVKDVSYQSVLVEADSVDQAMRFAEDGLRDNKLEFDMMTQSYWEPDSAVELKDDITNAVGWQTLPEGSDFTCDGSVSSLELDRGIPSDCTAKALYYSNDGSLDAVCEQHKR